jgi:nitrogen regulatory protein PII 2
MKNIMAIIRINKMNETKKALSDIDFPCFLATDKAMGRGKGKYDLKILEGAKAGHPEAIAKLGGSPPLSPRRILNIVVPDDKVDEVVQTIIDVNQASEAGDGKIFVTTEVDAIRVRTGETGLDAI